MVGITAYAIRKRSIQVNNSKNKLKLQDISIYNSNLNNAMESNVSTKNDGKILNKRELNCAICGSIGIASDIFCQHC